MLNIRDVLQQKPHIFNVLANRWQQITDGTLLLLSLKGDLIAVENGTASYLSELILKTPSGEIAVAPNVRATLVPLVIQGNKVGYLLSNNNRPEYSPMLYWAADRLATDFENELSLWGMTDELIAAWNQLDLVYHITKTLAEKSDLSDALNSILKEVISVVKVETGFVLLAHADKVECVTAGVKQPPELMCPQSFLDRVVKLKKVVLISNREELLDLWPEAPGDLQNFAGASISTSNKTAATLGLINKYQQFTTGDVKLMTAIAEQMGAIIDNFSMHRELIMRERVARELEIAAEIQESLLPKTVPEMDDLSIAVSTMPAYEVGGDFYDFIRTGENQITIAVGDVAGKGIPAAMFTSMVRTMLKVETFHSQEPHIIIKRVNEILYQDLSQAELFVTAFMATFDTKNNVLMYANAGHTPGIIYHAQSKTSRLLKATSLPIGVLGDDYKTTQYVHLAPGDTLVLYSDGITEAKNPQGERFGLQRVQHLIHQHADKSPSILKQIILTHLADFQQEALATDDVTLVVIKFSGKHTGIAPEQEWDILEVIPFQYKADTTYLTDISHQVTAACRMLNNLPSDAKGDDFIYLVELAVSEICTNMIEHSYADNEGIITGQIILATGGIQVDVYDQGRSFNPDAVPPPMSDPMDPSEGGYGLHIVRQIMDIAEYEPQTSRGNHWRLVKYIPQ